jgi:phage shock protein C
LRCIPATVWGEIRRAATFEPLRCIVGSDAIQERAMSLSDELSKLAELRASGTLSEDEFVRAKERLLNAQNVSSTDPALSAVNTFRRSRSDRVLGGVCGGMGKATGVEAWVWRLLFAVLFIFAGAGLLVYLLLWIFVPSE